MAQTPEYHNIKNWHWTEKDFTEWATQRLKELLTFSHHVDDVTEIEVEQDSVKGEAFKYNRKNKIRMSYDYKCTMKYKLKTPGSDLIEGTIHIEPFVDDESEDAWDFEMKIKNIQKLSSEQIARTQQLVGKSIIIPRIQTFIQEFDLKNE